MFHKIAAEKIGAELPLLLGDFEFERGAKQLGDKGGVLAAVMQYVSASFVAYEMKIAELNDEIRKLRKENDALRGNVLGAKAMRIVSGGKDSDGSVVEYCKRTLRRHASSVVDAVLKESKGCPVRSVVLAREVLRRLEG